MSKLELDPLSLLNSFVIKLMGERKIKEKKDKKDPGDSFYLLCERLFGLDSAGISVSGRSRPQQFFFSFESFKINKKINELRM
jgi:hypothetical protein